MRCYTGNIQNFPRQLVMQSCVLCMFVRFGTSNHIEKKKKKKIGTAGKKDKLTFLSFVYQIQNGVKRNYSESDICDAVIKSISSELPLRAYLEGKYHLDLKILSKILRSHFKDATALFNLLGSTCQRICTRICNPLNEFKADKVLFVSKEDSY